ncbi:MAG: hypothetical protein RIQ56_328 [Candidatus Parcubacteria bacterium]
MPKLPFELPELPIDPLVFLAVFGIFASLLYARQKRPWLGVIFALIGGFCLALVLQRRGLV